LRAVANAIFKPCERLMRRLKLAQKFALITVVLVTPMAFVAISYIGGQNTQAAFAVKERAGLAASRPMLAMLGAVDRARSAAAHGRAIPVSSVDAAVGRVDGALAQQSTQINVSASWSALKTKIALAAGLTRSTGAAAVHAWSGVSGDLVSLIAKVADESNLTLDPVFESYYVQDALTVKIPTLLDASGLGADLAAVDAKRHHDEIAIANGTVSSTMAGLATDLQKAGTGDPQLGSAAVAPLAALSKSTTDLTTALSRVIGTDRAPATDITPAGRRDALALAGALAPELEGLLVSHIDGFQHNEHVVELVAAIALALALWLFAGFFRSMTGSVKELTSVLSGIESGDLSRTASTSRDEVGQLGVALNRMRERMSEMVDGIARTSVTLSSASEELSAVSREMNTAAVGTADQAGSVSAAAEQVSHSVQSVSAGTEEMGASIHEIAKQTSDAARVATEAVAVAETTNDLVLRLGASSTEIDEVIKVISSIAKQTNLLALNARIEAARAGEAGKGFAVVANEVKELARETARSSEKIERNIGTIQADTQEAVSAIGRITSIIHQINDIQTMIAASVEEQAATTSEIARSVAEAAAGSNEIARSVTGVADTAKNTTTGAADTHVSAEALAHLATELLSLTRQFRLAEAEKPAVAAATNGGPPSPGANGSGTVTSADLEALATANGKW
jgi:methyl-accepting chemotaxis protein